MDTLRQDLFFAGRGLLRAPMFAALAVATLALGIGANTAVWSVVRGVLLAPLSFENPDDIVRLWPARPFSQEMIEAFREQSRAFEGITAYRGGMASLRTADGAVPLAAESVMGDYFAVVGGGLALGRPLLPTDGAPGAPPVVVIGHGLWQTRLAAAPEIIGRDLVLDGVATTVVGVRDPEATTLIQGSQLWRPMSVDPTNIDSYRDMMVLPAVARLAPGVTLEQASAEVGVVARALRRALPDYHGERQVRTATAVRLHDRLVRRVRTPLWILLAAAGLVLLIACANVSTMLLGRTARRRRELATRSALGATRLRLVRQLMTESALLGTAGGLVGGAAAWWLESLLLAMLPASLPRAREVGIALPELLFALLVSLLTVAVFGLLPALRAARPRRGLAGGPGGGADVRSRHFDHALVATEVALAVTLVIGSGLMIKSLFNLSQEEPGFEASEVLSLRFRPPASFADDAALEVYLERLVDAAAQVPGARSAALIDILPMSGGNRGLGYSTPDHPAPADAPPASVNYRVVGGDYFRTLGIPLVHGRLLGPDDRATAPSVGVINQRMASALWPADDPVGKELRWPDGSPWLTIVGVVGDVRHRGLARAPDPVVYQSVAQAGDTAGWFAAPYLTVRAAGEPAHLANAVEQAMRSVDADVAITQIRPLDEVVGGSVARTRFSMRLLTVFAMLALVLAALGVYGVGAHAVSRRVREIGIRLALGARRRAVVRTVLAGELRAVAIGLGAGALGGLGASQALRSQLHGVATTDIWVVATAAGVLAVVAACATVVPARRAARVEPAVTLRAE